MNRSPTLIAGFVRWLYKQNLRPHLQNIKSLFSLKGLNLSIIDGLILTAMLFIGSDKISIQAGGITIRFIQLLLFITGIFYIGTGKLHPKHLLLFIFFICANLMATFQSVDINSSILYIIWTLFNYIFIFLLFYNWSRKTHPEKVLNILFYSFLLQGIYIFIQFYLGLKKIPDPFFGTHFHGDIPRPSIWFYEPSFLATYLTLFVALSVFLFLNLPNPKRKYWLGLALAAIICTTSSAGYIGIALCIFFGILFSPYLKFNYKIKNFFLMTITVSLFLLVINIIKPEIIDTFIGRLFRIGIQRSSGNRFDIMSQTISVIDNFFFFGIGPGAYPFYTKGSPPSNITLEILANLGLTGLISFGFFAILPIIYLSAKLKHHHHSEAVIAKGFIFAFWIFLIVLQANQNYLRLYIWMFLGLICGISEYALSNKPDSRQHIKIPDINA